MSGSFPISTLIAWSKISQYLASNDKGKSIVFKGGMLASESPELIYVVRKLVEFTYNRNQNDSTLFLTGPFLYSLISKYVGQASQIYAGSGCISPTVIVNPLTQTVGSGGNVTFISVFNGTNLTYQWQYNDTNITGATSSTYTKIGVTFLDGGNYRCVATNSCGTATTSEAVLTVGAGDLIGYYYYGDTDYSAQLQMGIDNITYNGTFPIVDGQPLLVPFPEGASNNKFNITKYPAMQGTKTAYDNHVPVVGSIPDFSYADILTFSNFSYIYSRNAMSLNSSFPMIFT